MSAALTPVPSIPAVEIRNAHKAFAGTEVIRGIDLSLPAGGVTVILGPSGSGKSTLLRAINHLEPLDHGYIAVHGELIGVEERRGRLHELTGKAIRRQRTRIGFVAQSFNLFPHLTVAENVAEPLLAHKRATKGEARIRAQELLSRVGLGTRGDAYPRQLSGGQQQRVAIARALALKPDVLLFDEPTSALDPELVGEVLAVIRELARDGTTLVIVSHEIGFAREVADHVVFIDGGVVVEQGAPAQVIDHPTHARTREFLGKVL
ncbi:amino acid ABC transporter ATP-binding protein [Nocardioides sp. Kera G14]|uniref:amino acid ABC transporter ATP-binding protein n=1 Tax=Nocardioides sp. Kera G14 TaxID=2884264 RepID=UPI001D0F6E3A|nr:amino acid ABC transporter ATP-binding protein [Nocardioides sp. Kera G14]UDY24387.1 amino acid ABC transporter ATP-binding protein [Nocardioides sp. Kera G14]